MSTGLLASTVTPGSTAPDVSFTVPEMLAALEPCASAALGKSITHVRKPRPILRIRRMPSSIECHGQLRGGRAGFYTHLAFSATLPKACRERRRVGGVDRRACVGA